MNDGMSGEQLNDLLTRCFPEEEVRLLQYFFQKHADAEHFTYAEVRLPEEDSHDLLMLGLEQRVILPEKTRMGPAWVKFSSAVIFILWHSH